MTKIRSAASSIFDHFASDNQAQIKASNVANTVIAPIYTLAEDEVVRIFGEYDWSFSEEDTTYLSHDIHPYPAKFPPQLPAQIIKLLSSTGETVWDPFGGSGTTALEALLNDRCCISTDINPIGSIIGRAKTTALCAADECELDKFIAKLEYYISEETYLVEYINSHREELELQIPQIPNIEKWFNSAVICELAFIKHLIKTVLQSKAANNIAKASLSKIVTKVSNQENETTYRAVSKEIPVGNTTKIYLKDLKANYAKIKILSSQIGYRTCRFITTDVMAPLVGDGMMIKNNEVDLVVTSPPYPNAFDYHLYHRFRIFWLDGDPREMGKAEIGSHLKYQRSNNSFEKFEEEMAPVLENCFHSLKNGRYAAFILGNAMFDGAEYKTAERIGVVAERIGFKQVAIIDRPLPENKRSVKSWARRANTEQILLLKKPDVTVSGTLTPVAYKLWPYEKVISDLEKDVLCGSTDNSFCVNSSKINGLKKLTFYKSFSYDHAEFETWQSVLENSSRDSSSGRKEPKYLTHGIHPYKGKFYPQLVRPLLNILQIPDGGTVFDPFCGSGTIALEAILNGYNAYGCDINPVAVDIATAKNTIFTVAPYEFERHISMFRAELSEYEQRDYSHVFSDESIGEIRRWFPEAVIGKMGFILTKIRAVPDERIKCFLKVVLSSIIREVSQQDPSDLRIRRRKEPINDAPVIEMFMECLDKQYSNIMGYYKVCNSAPSPIGNATIWRGNSKNTEVLVDALPEEGVDIVITSPPYATALPYIDTNRLNMLVLNGINASMRVPIEAEMTGTREITKSTRLHYEKLIDEDCFGSISSPLAREIIKKIHAQNKDSEVGFRRKNMSALIYMYFHDMSDVMLSLDRVVKKQGYICMVIGDTQTTTAVEKVIIRTTEMLRETAVALGWTLVKDIPISVTVERYLHMNNSITENNVLIFQKN